MPRPLLPSTCSDCISLTSPNISRTGQPLCGRWWLVLAASGAGQDGSALSRASAAPVAAFNQAVARLAACRCGSAPHAARAAHAPRCDPRLGLRSARVRIFDSERELCLLKEHAEGTYKTKHAEAARLYYTTILRHIDT